ncbi:MAG: DotU family type IV/VI secretion system protein [Planctomycetes bacterium]|nr:DotU family type IV/VI secretion system protein [Planctomycetota bacterium]
MAAKLWDLASPVLLTLSVLVRNAERKRPPSYEQARKTLLDLLARQEREADRMQMEAAWLRARSPLVYLIDEVMVLDLAWSDENRKHWQNETLEVTYLHKPQPMRAVDFFKECDEVQQELFSRVNEQERLARQDLLEVFYVCLKLGFRGRYRRHEDQKVQGHTLSEYMAVLFDKLPAKALLAEDRVTGEAYKHTDDRQAVYTFGWTIKTCLAVLIGIALMYSIVTWTTWHRLTKDVNDIAEQKIQQTVREADTTG